MGLITTEIRGAVALIGLNDPAHLNAFSMQLLEDLHEAVVTQAAAGIKRFVFHGHGTSFSSGAHMDDYLATLDAVQRHDAQRFYDSEKKILQIARILRRPEVFSVTAVHGWAVGMGVEVALACDFIVASEDASFWLPETAAGWNAGMGTTKRLTSTVGSGWARRMLLLGEKVPAAKAEQIGLVTRVVPNGEHLKGALDILEVIARRSPLATEYEKKLLDILPDMALEDSMELEVITGYWLAHTRDVREAAQAFVERRKPSFNGT